MSQKDEENSGYDQSEFYESFFRIHKDCSIKNQSPRKFIAFIQNYKNIYFKKCGEIDSKKTHLQVCAFLFNCINRFFFPAQNIKQGNENFFLYIRKYS